MPLVLGTLFIIVFLWNAIPAEMAPLEDRSQISINTRGAEGVTYEYIRDYTCLLYTSIKIKNEQRGEPAYHRNKRVYFFSMKPTIAYLISISNLDVYKRQLCRCGRRIHCPLATRRIGWAIYS